MNKIELVINKKKRTYSFGLGSIGDALEHLDTDIDSAVQMLIKNPYRYTPIFMFHSAKNPLERKGKNVSFTLDSLMDDIDADGGINIDSVSKYLKLLYKTLYENIPVHEEDESKEPKKK